MIDSESESILNDRPKVRALYEGMAARTDWTAKLESGDRDPRLSTMVGVCKALDIDVLEISITARAS